MRWKSILPGAATGFLNGVFGGGGGMVVVPLLQTLGLREKEAHATAILIILPVSFAGAIGYLVSISAGWNVLIPCILGFTAGGLLGSKLLAFLPGKIVGYLFAALMLFAGIRMAF